jgi:hypothetical protein
MPFITVLVRNGKRGRSKRKTFYIVASPITIQLRWMRQWYAIGTCTLAYSGANFASESFVPLIYDLGILYPALGSFRMSWKNK